ncbi:hypothetical protein E2C01_084496 [Portunus trituberculatus]|uniref:Uncharacterized protein n=1 Tax=Portunus trituberculatus TaxID=210409 RepID=A0A5B7J057_PORTR|nr:hypothetical protein [Portunus trituberculatus]
MIFFFLTPFTKPSTQVNGFLVAIDADWAAPRRTAIVSGHKGRGAAVIAHDGKESTTDLQAACEASTSDGPVLYNLVSAKDAKQGPRNTTRSKITRQLHCCRLSLTYGDRKPVRLSPVGRRGSRSDGDARASVSCRGVGCAAFMKLCRQNLLSTEHHRHDFIGLVISI